MSRPQTAWCFSATEQGRAGQSALVSRECWNSASRPSAPADRAGFRIAEGGVELAAQVARGERPTTATDAEVVCDEMDAGCRRIGRRRLYNVRRRDVAALWAARAASS